jgi:hypothetical protein
MIALAFYATDTVRWRQLELATLMVHKTDKAQESIVYAAAWLD